MSKQEFYSEVEKEETIKIKCPLCNNEMKDISSSIPLMFRGKMKKVFCCPCENVVLNIEGRNK